MKKTKFHRLIAFALALCFLIGGVLTTTVAAETENESGYLDEIRKRLSTISYAEYVETYKDLPAAAQPIVINAVQDLDTGKTTEGSYKKLENDALFTSNTGKVTWTIDLATAAKYSIVINYWPDAPATDDRGESNGAKTSSIERILEINGAIPFAEARYVTLPKVWGSEYVAARVDASKDASVDELYDAAIAAGFTADEVAKNADEDYIELTMPKVWTKGKADFVNNYAVRFFTTDIDNNELRPVAVQAPESRSFELRDADGFYAESFEFALVPVDGKVSITLEAVNEPMTVESILLIPHQSYMSYEDYAAQYKDAVKGEGGFIIQSEYIGATSTRTVYPIEDRTDAATQPADTNRVVLNTIGGEKWQTAGQWVRYTFKVEKSGMYNIAARYRQNVLDGMYVSRALYLYSGEGVAEGQKGYYNGIPFAEAAELRFNYNAKWQSTVMTNGDVDEDGNPITYNFYFEEGVEYTMQLQVTVGSMGDIVRRVQAILDSINNDYLAILKLTGASPDEYRDYGFSRIMPDTLVDMILQSRALYYEDPETGEKSGVAVELAAITGEKSSNVATLEKVAWLLERMGSDEDQIAKYLDQLKSYIGSLGTWLSDAKTQPLQLDYIAIQPADTAAPKAEAGFFASFLHEIKSFIMSFFRNYDRMGATAEDEEGAHSIDVWIATGRDQAQVLRNLVNNDFTPEYGVAVNLQLVAGGTLLPSVLSGMGPDVYIGLSEDNVINYAIRGALLPVENMEGFADYALAYMVDENFQKILGADGKPIENPNSNFNEAAMLVLGIEDAEGVFHYYGLPEAQGFNMMFVRTDVLADLGVKDVPETWDDVLELVPILQANNMQIGMHTDYKVFLYQMGGELFADDGMRINLDSDVGLEAFDTMCSYFTMYSFPYSYDFANRFRTGEMPIGFGSYTGVYNQLTVFATEIKGLWEFFPLPGIRDENGEINNVAVSTVTAIVMMNGCDNEEDAWKFMKWHSGTDCQIKYANEMEAIIGPSAKNSTANKHALAQMPWTRAEYDKLISQFNNLASIPNYPGSYIIGRYTNFAFLAAYNDNANPVTELQSYITTINKEITRKREEFGLETLELGQTLTQKRLGQVEEAFEQDTDKMSDSVLDAASAAIKLMKEGIKKQNAQTLTAARDAFQTVDAEAFADTIKALNNAILVLSKH